MLLKVNSEIIKEKETLQNNKINNKLLLELSYKNDWSKVYCYDNVDQAIEWFVNSIKDMITQAKSGRKNRKKQRCVNSASLSLYLI